MKQKKKIHKGLLGVILALVLCLSMLPVTVFAEAGSKTQGGGQLTEESVLSEQSLVQTQDEKQAATPSASSEQSSTTQKESSDSSEQNTTSPTASHALYEQSSTQTSNSNVSNASNIDFIKDLIASLPEAITEENADEVRTQLAEIFALYEALSTDEQNQIDMSCCNELQEKLDASSLVPAEGEVARVTLADGSSTEYTSITTAFTAANTAGTATVTLLEDCTLSSISVTGSNITLDLNNCTLAGNRTNSVLYVASSSASLTINDTSAAQGGKITGGSASRGGGVHVNGGTLVINGGEISNNTASYYGGGVYVDRGTLVINGGKISNNTATDYGGGIYTLYSTTFTMYGGTISGNATTATSGNKGYGGGVHVSGDNSTIFTMYGGIISENTGSQTGGGVYVGSTTFIMENGLISKNTSDWGGGVIVSQNSSYNVGKFFMNGGEISGNTGDFGAGLYVNGRNRATATMTGGKITGNSATSHGGGVCVEGPFIITGGEISGNTAALTGGGISIAPEELEGTVRLSGSPIISSNTSGAPGSKIADNIATMGARIILDDLNETVRFGVSVYQNSNGTYEYVRPTVDAPVQFTTAESTTSYYASSVDNFFSDREGYIVRANDTGKYLELTPVLFEVKLNPQGGVFDDGSAETKTIDVAYGETYGKLGGFPANPTRTGYYFAGWGYDTHDPDDPHGNHLHIGKDTQVATTEPHTLYAHWVKKKVPEISFSGIPQTYTYDGQEHPFTFEITSGPNDDWEIYYLEHTGDTHAKPTSLDQLSTDPPIDVDDYCIVVVHEEVDGTDPDGSDSWAYFESEIIHNGVIIKPATITLTGDVSKMYDGSAEIPITADDITLPEDSIYDRDKDKVELVVADNATLTLNSADAGTTGVGELKGVYLTGDAAKNYTLEYQVSGVITENTNEYTLTFETNGGSVIDPVTKRYGSVIDLTSYTPTKEGYSFTGWYTDEALTDKIESITLIGDTTVYAGWEEEPNEPDDPEPVDPEPVDPDDRGIDPGTDPGSDSDSNPNNEGDADDGTANSSDASDDGSTLPLTGSALQIGLLLLVICSLTGALIVAFSHKRKRGKHSF